MTLEKKIAAYGTWTSPISAELVSSSIVSLNEVHVNKPTTGAIFLVEGRPTEEGRCCIVDQRGTESIDILPAPYSAKSRVHEYGGGACAISPDGSLIFTDASTNGVFRAASGQVDAILQLKDVRFAAFCVHQTDPQWILAVQEDHNGAVVENSIVAINANTNTVHLLKQGADFYSHPQFSPDGKYVSWTQWNHPDMAWKGTELYVAEWKDGKVLAGTHIAGKAATESICQPRWNSNEILYFMSDRTGFWQLYSCDATSLRVERILVAGLEDADLAVKEGRLGNSSYAPLDQNKLVIVFIRNATSGIVVVDTLNNNSEILPLGLVDTGLNAIRRVTDTEFVVIGTTATAPEALYRVDITKGGEKTLLKSSAKFSNLDSFYSAGEHISFPRTRGREFGLSGVAHGIFIHPKNHDYEAPAGTKPPLIVSAHGGPNAHAKLGLSLMIQYWTSRGFAWVDVNYLGSTGYGRAYREGLDGLYGLAEPADAASCVDFLSSKGLIDLSRVGIMGQSSGGYAVLQSLIHYPDLWSGGISSYGIGDLNSLDENTHKYESHCLIGLLNLQGATESQKDEARRSRSPCNHVEKIKCPVLLTQGSDDRVVPLDQAENIYGVLKERGLDTKLVVFPGEGHGWKMRSTIMQCIEEEEAWFKMTLIR